MRPEISVGRRGPVRDGSGRCRRGSGQGAPERGDMTQFDLKGQGPLRRPGMDNGRGLRDNVLDNQQRPERHRGRIAAVELHVVCTQIVVIILRKAQAELRGPRQADVRVCRGTQHR